MKTVRWSWGVLLALMLTGAANARDIFVNNVTGDNRRKGGAETVQGDDGPFRTIDRALRAARAGDRVIVANTGQPYREMISIQSGRHRGTFDQPFRLVSNGAVLDGTREIPLAQWQYHGEGMYRYKPPGMTRQILYMNGKPAKRVAVKRGDELPKLEPLQWCFWEQQIYFRPEDGKSPEAYELSHTHLRVGITIYETQHVLISGFVVQGYELDGINAHDSVFEGELYGVTCRGNARSGVSIGGASRVKLTACLLGNNGEAQLRTEGFSTTEIVRSDLLDNTAPRIVREGGKIIERAPAEEGAAVGASPKLKLRKR